MSSNPQLEDAPPRRRARDLPRRAAALVAEVLAECGVEVVFGLPGGTISPVNDALLDLPSVRSVVMRHETSAVFAAAGYAYLTGRPGVVTVTSGPGITNALTGLAAVYCEGLPVVILAGEVPRNLQGRGALQDGSAHHLGMVEVARRLTKLSVEVTEPASAPSVIRRAMATACSGKPGAVMVTLPLSVLMQEVTEPRIAHDVATHFALADWAVEQAVTSLVRSERVLIFAGAGCTHGKAPALLLALAERLQAPVMTTPKAKGCFPEDHRLALGVHGIGGHPSTSEALTSGVDTLLVVGSSLGDLETDGFRPELVPRRSLIQIDVDSSIIGRSYPVDLAITAPAEQALAEIVRRLPGQPRPVAEHGVRLQRDPRDQDPQRPIAPHRAVWEIQQVLPDDTLYAIDSGEHFMYATHFLRLNRAKRFIAMTGLGSMGSSIPAALGAALGGHTSTAVIIGDGGFAMVGTDVATAAAQEIPLRVFVFNDGRMMMCEVGHESVFCRTPTFPVAAIDIPAFAEAVGAVGLCAEREGDILALAPVFANEKRPVIVDVRIDASARMQKRDRIGAMGRAVSS